jgi:hypothetical protein
VAIDYRGPFSEEVATCVQIASAGALRDDTGVPSRIWVDSVEAAQTDLSTDGLQISYTVDGKTHTDDAAGTHTYDWSCTLKLDIEDRTLTARLSSFVKSE